MSQDIPEDGWRLSWEEAHFNAQPTPFRHLQFFPDMAPVWEWMRAQLDRRDDAETLNLFGYTGVGSLALSKHGRVTHVDASKKSVAQARDNAALSGMEDRPIRWLVDDAAELRDADFQSFESIAVTAGASAPDSAVESVLDWFTERFDAHVETPTPVDERRSFPLPRALRTTEAPATFSETV